MGSRLIWLVALWAVLGCSRGLVQPSNNGESCHPDKLTVYRMVLHTFWTREKFPKHYPDWRPTAQWSKLYGLSHDSSHILFRLGQRVSAGVRAFAESGRADALEAAHGALDTFAAPALAQGIARSEAEFFVDGNHSRVSVMSRMVPSPDWFIGIDSFDLCVDGNWLDSITIEVDPIDAGTDNGFTFTAPNWPTAPQGVAYRITSRYPSHPAGSFFYPHLRRLPPIATFQFIKLREYEVSEVFSHESDERRYEVVRLERLAHNSIDVLDGNAALAAADERERAEQVAPTAAVGSTASGVTWSWPANVSRASTAEPRSANEVAAGDTRAIMRGLARRYRRRQIPAERRARRKKTKSPADCRVSPWGAWSACSCGAAHVGESRRERRVMRRARGGRSCPPLRQTRWCAACQTDNYTVERGNNQW